MGAPKGSSRLVQRIGRANHRMDEASEGIVVPGNRFEYLEARAALDAIERGELDPDLFRPGALDVLAQHVMACACAAPFAQGDMLDEVRSAAPFAGLSEELFDNVLSYIENGGYSLKAYDRFQAPDPRHGRLSGASRTPSSRRSTASTPASSSMRRCSTSASRTAASSAPWRNISPRR
jgi:Lhr-like helicase